MPLNVIEEPKEAIKSAGIDWFQVFDQRLVKINIAVFLTYKDSHLLGESSSLLVTTRSSNLWSCFHTILIDCSCIYAETGFLRMNRYNVGKETFTNLIYNGIFFWKNHIVLFDQEKWLSQVEEGPMR